MDNKQIFAAVEITDHEVRLIVGEFFNTRFNIIKVERVPVSGLSGNAVTDETAVIEAVRKAAADAEKMIGAPVKKVILGLPSHNMKRYSLRSTVKITGIDGTITVEDVREAMRKAEAIKIDKNYALIQTVCVKYTVNGITSRRMPIGEKAYEMTVDIDLLCADRKLSFDLVNCVEKAGLQVMDIYLDIFAVAKEAALFEQAVNQNVIVLKMERENTTLGLITKGKLNACMIEPLGVGTIAGAAVDAYGLKGDVATELVKYSVRLDERSASANPVYIWAENGETRKINEMELYDCIRPQVDEWLSSIGELCGSILQAGPTAVIITGEGGEMQGLDVELQRRLKCEVRNYIPETLGGRNAGLTACLGLFYAYKDKLPISGYVDSSLDMEAFLKAVSYREREKNGTEQEDTLTNKLRRVLLDGRK